MSEIKFSSTSIGLLNLAGSQKQEIKSSEVDSLKVQSAKDNEGQEEDHGTRCSLCDKRSLIDPCIKCQKEEKGEKAEKKAITLADSRIMKKADGTTSLTLGHEDWIRVGLSQKWMTQKEAEMSRSGKWSG